MPRGTPLYGQPAWWGEDEADEKGGCKPDSKREEKMHETAASGKSLFSLFSNSLGGFCCPVEFRVLWTRDLNNVIFGSLTDSFHRWKLNKIYLKKIILQETRNVQRHVSDVCLFCSIQYSFCQ